MNAQPIIEAAGIHGFFLFGTTTLYASHMPMFTMGQHRYQVELRVCLPDEVMDIYRAGIMSAPTAWNVTNGESDKVALPQIKSGEITSYPVDVYRDYTDSAPVGDPVARGVTLTVHEIVHFRHFQFDTPRPDHLTYLLYGRSGEAHLSHYVARDPDFHHIVTLGSPPHWVSADQLAGGVTISFPDIPSLPVPCHSPLTAVSYRVLFEGLGDAAATLDLTGARTVWFSAGNLLNATDPCRNGTSS
jgi:hypothetical protein